jgi:hypothetical protein
MVKRKTELILNIFGTCKVMKQILIYSSLFFLSSCNFQFNQPQKTSECPQKTTAILIAENLENVNLTTETITKSNQVSSTKAVGYTFKGKSGQTLSYNTDDDICVWLYSPDNQILQGTKLPEDGKYLLQIAAPKGSKTFKIEMSLGTPLVSTSVIANQPELELSSTISSSQPSPEEAVHKYYSTLNQGQYNLAWEQLSEELRNNRKLHPNGYYSYRDWWSTVRKVELRSVELVNKDFPEAAVDVKLTYILKTGQLSNQSLQLFLFWNAQEEQWNINKAKLIT